MNNKQLNVLVGAQVKLESSELWSIIDWHYPETDEIIGPKALVSWEQTGYKLTAWAAQAMQNGLPVLIIGDSGLKFQAQYVKRLMAMGRDVVYHNRKLGVYGHHTAGRPYHPDDAHSDFYKEFGIVLNAEDDAYWASVPEQVETWSTGWAVPEQVADDPIPRWLQATKLEAVRWTKQLANGRRYNQDDSTWVPDYDQDVACRILGADDTLRQYARFMELSGTDVEPGTPEWEELGRLESLFVDAERYQEWQPVDQDDPEYWEAAIRK